MAVLAGPRLKACFLEVLFLRPLGTSLPVSEGSQGARRYSVADQGSPFKSKSTIVCYHYFVAQLSVFEMKVCAVGGVSGAKRAIFILRCVHFAWGRLEATISRVVGINV